VKGNQKLVYQAQGMQLSAATTAAGTTTATTIAATTTAAANAATIAVLPSASIASYHNALGTDTIAVMPASTTASYYNNGVVAVASIGANTNFSAIAKGASSYTTSLAPATAANRSWGHGVSLRGIPTSYLI
jgi:hypothetical protein